MKKRRKIIPILVILGCLLLGNITIVAADNKFQEFSPSQQIIISEPDNSLELLSSPSLSGCTLEIGAVSNGIEVAFVTRATQTANEIGVKNIVLQEKNLFGWTDIPISNHYTNNSDMYSGGVVYTQAEKGKTYRVYCTHYAKFGNTELTLYNTVDELTYN